MTYLGLSKQIIKIWNCYYFNGCNINPLWVVHFLSAFDCSLRVQIFKVWKVGAGEAKSCSQHDRWKHQNIVCPCLLWSRPFSYLFRFPYQHPDEWGFPRAFPHSTVIALGLSECFKQMKTKKASHIIQCLIAFPHGSGEKHSSALSSSEWLTDWIQ